MRRLSGPLLWLLLLALVGGFAWLTRHPDSGLLMRAQRWPFVGPLAAGFRAAYLPEKAATSTATDAASPAVEVVVEPVLVEDLEARPFLWVEPGTRIHLQPDLQSPVLETVESLRNLSRLQKQGDWYRVRWPRPGRPPLKGWVHLEDYQEPSPEVLRQPDPVLPLPAAPPDPGRVAAARALMDDGGTESRCGGHPLYTDAALESFATVCSRLAAAVEEIYRQRYGLEPVSPAAEGILLFRRAEAYRSFRDREQIAFDSNRAHAIPARGYLALFVGERPREAVLSTLVHELVHLLNRRALGPALPAWLSEGLADDLAQSKLAADGLLQPGVLGGESRTDGWTVVRRGGIASAVVLQEGHDHGSLPALVELVRLDPEEFYRSDRAQLNYALSSFWVRYLLSDFESGLAEGFLDFLQAVSHGTPLSEELLVGALGEDWGELERGFRIWLRLQFLRPANESEEDRGDRAGSQSR